MVYSTRILDLIQGLVDLRRAARAAGLRDLVAVVSRQWFKLCACKLVSIYAGSECIMSGCTYFKRVNLIRSQMKVGRWSNRVIFVV